MSQYFGHNFQLKNPIEVNQAVLERYLEFLQIILK